MKLTVARGVFQDHLIDGLIDELTVDLPEALVDAEMEASVHNLYHSLQAQSIDLADYLRITGQTKRRLLRTYGNEPPARSRPASCSRRSLGGGDGSRR